MKNLLNLSEIKVEFIPEFKLSQRPQVHSAEEAYKLFMQVWDKSIMDFIEEFKIMLMNETNTVLGIADINVKGKVNIKEIFSIALITSASKIILAHNRPCERLSMRYEDRLFMQKIMNIGRLLDIELYEYLIVTDNDYLSVLDGECLM